MNSRRVTKLVLLILAQLALAAVIVGLLYAIWLPAMTGVSK
jgi:hypothetical protein